MRHPHIPSNLPTFCSVSAHPLLTVPLSACCDNIVSPQASPVLKTGNVKKAAVAQAREEEAEAAKKRAAAGT